MLPLVIKQRESKELGLFHIYLLKSLQVSNEAYLLGLLDCIGELKRLVFDKIRSGKGIEAIKIFEIMENLYLNLYPFATFDKIVKETRRKLDVNRFLIEETRAAITEEIRSGTTITIEDDIMIKISDKGNGIPYR